MKKIKILIVDDERIVIESVIRHLRHEEDYELSSAESADAAVMMLSEASGPDREYDIVITDLMMPGMDGMELLEWLKDNSRPCLALMITGYATISTALRATRLGAFDYIAKPFTRDELLRVVKRAAGLVRASGGARLRGDVRGGMMKIGENTWMKKQPDGTVLLGAGKDFTDSPGDIRSVYLPAVGDVLRQGSVFFQAFMADMSSRSLLSPLSGTVSEVNQTLANDPGYALLNSEDGEKLCGPAGQSDASWLIRLVPANEHDDIKILGGN